MWYVSVVAALILSVNRIWAQPEGVTTSPFDGQSDVSTSACVRVRAPSPIFPSSVSGRLPASSSSGHQMEPTVLVVRRSIIESTDRKDWTRRSVIGAVSFVDERTVEWKPRRLMPGTTYHCVVQGLMTQSPTGPVPISPVEFDFTTSPDVPKVATTTIDSVNIIQCSTIVWIRFTEALDNDLTVSDLITVQQPEQNGYWAPVRHAQVCRAGRNTLAVFSREGWSTSVPLRINVNLSKITGTTDDDRRLEAMVRGAGRVIVTAQTADGQTLPESVTTAAATNEAVVSAGGRLVASMPEQAENQYRFVRWESPNVPSADMVTTSTLDLPVSCTQLHATLDLRAIYEPIDSIDVSITVDSLGDVTVTDQDGSVLAVVVDSANLRIATTVQRLNVLAQSATGATFTSWSSSIIGCNGNASPALSIPQAVLLSSSTHAGANGQMQGGGQTANNVPHVHINPIFQKLTPMTGDRYRLRAKLANSQVEELHRIDQHIQFTTETEFEDVQRVVRTVCVVADDCWEITGYQDAAKGNAVWFAKGRRELCVESELLNPENTLTIFGQRIPIDLRIDRVLLGSEHDDNVLLDRQPHPETRIDIDKLVSIRGVDSWQPLFASSCAVSNIAQQSVGLRCGDEVRITVRAAVQRGEEWRWWSNRPKYVQPRAGTPRSGAHVFTLTISKDLAQFDAKSCDGADLGHREIAMRAAFRQQFVVDSIALRVRTNARGERWKAEFKERWFDPLTYYDRASDEPYGCRQLEYVPRRGTTVKLKFSRPLDVTTINAGGITASCFASILHTDPQEKNLDFTTSSSDRGNTNLLSSTGQFLDKVEMSIFEPGTKPVKQALHMGIIDLTCTSAIRSVDNEPLIASRQFTLNRMEIPGFGLRMSDAVFAFDGDTDWFILENTGELYHALYGMNIALNGAPNAADGFVRYPDCGQQQSWSGDCTVDYSDDGSAFSFGNREIWAQTAWMDADDKAFARIGSWDEDCKNNDRCLVNRIQGVLDSIRVRANAYRSDQGADFAKNIPFELISLGSGLISALLPIAEQDDQLGEATHFEGIQTLWGMSAPTAPRILINVENAEYRLSGQWFVSRAVVR